MIKPIKRLTLSEEVINQLVNLIRNGTWTPGEKTPSEIELAKSFSLSRNSMREALKSLVHAGILEAKSGCGTFVSQNAMRRIRSLELGNLLNEESFVFELLESRLIIEPQLVYIAAEKASALELDELDLSVQKALQALEENNYEVTLGFDFHRKIASVSQNRFLIKYLASIEEELNYQRMILGSSHANSMELKRELEEHAAIFCLIQSKKAIKARNAMALHLERAMKVLKEACPHL